MDHSLPWKMEGNKKDIIFVMKDTFTNLHCRMTQIGIVSKGRECAHPDYPGIYTRVTKFKEWVQAVAEDSLDSNCDYGVAHPG